MLLIQAGRLLSSIDDARPGRGDVRDTLGRVVYRDTLHGWIWVPR